MIRYALQCEKDHEFDGWFRSSSAFDEQNATREVECPLCGSHDVHKALMAPAIGKASDIGSLQVRREAARKMSMMMLEMRKHVEENCDYVGDQFVEEARRIHYGESEKRNIYGEASLEEARDLIEEGVQVAPLPIAPPVKAN